MRTVIAWALLSASLVGVEHAWADTGDLDPTFGTRGVVVTSAPPPLGFAWLAAVQQADGKLVVGGGTATGNPDFALARFLADGTLDPSFDGDGMAATDVGTSGVPRALAVQPDGKIVAAGNAGGVAVVRYHPDGTLDASFDGDGIVITTAPGGARAEAVALQPDGKIVVAGSAGSPFLSVLSVWRYESDGSPDATFDGDGMATASIGSFAFALDLALQPDGKIVVVGNAQTSDPSVIVVARFDAGGSLDPAFDGDGVVTTSVSGFDVATAVVLQPDGKILAGGGVPNGSGLHPTVIRYDTSGALDPSFDGDGIAMNDRAGAVAGLVLQSDGKPVIAFTDADDDVVLARLESDGAPDPTFYCGNDAVVTPGDPLNLNTQALLLQADGKPVVAGGSVDAAAFDFSGIVMRFGGTPTLTDHPVVPRKLVVVDKLATTSSAKAVYVVRDPGVAKGDATDANKIRARLDLAYQGGAESGALAVGCGSATGWVVNKDTVAKFVNNVAPSGPAQTRVAVVKPTLVARIVGKGLGEEPLDVLAAGPPPGSVFASFEVTNDTERHRHCSELTSCAWTSIAGGTGAKLVCRGGVPDPLCQASP